MKLKLILSILFLFIATLSFSQENLLTSFSIPPNLNKNANAVIRSNTVQVELKSHYEMFVSVKRIITVFNKEGNHAINAYVHYDNNVKIKNLEAIVYNNFGNQIKKIKKHEFKDVSAVDGGTLYSDSRVKYLEFTPISYPYTIEFVCETISNNTAFIQSFMPIDEYFVSVENSSYQINYPLNLKIRTKEKNFQDFDLQKEKFNGQIKYHVKNIQALKPEEYAPAFFDIAPKVLLASKYFTLEGVRSQVETWDDFAKWMYHDLIKSTHDLPESTITMVQDLVKNEPNNIAKAKKIYEYVQNKVRYISVQVGIGGWKPFNASEVDRLGYGDCKALTNYTMALLQAVGITSNYTVVYAGESQRHIENDFAAMMGNHVILNIPTDTEDVWLECTSQKLPFGFIGDFTDDRDVLVITPNSGKIKHTKKYSVNENIQKIKGRCSITNNGVLNTNVMITSKGIQYDSKYWLETEVERDLNEHYKNRWRYINNITINNITIENNKNNAEFIEHINFNATNYTKKVGNRMLLTLNALNRNTHIPNRYRNRKLPLKINRGFKDIDELEIKLPTNYKVEAIPKNKTIQNKFGSYKTEFVVIDENTLIYKREFIINDGLFTKEDYSPFREFYKEVSKQDNAKVALIKK